MKTGAWLVTAALLAAPSLAAAAGGKVIVAGPESDPLAARMQKELGAMGFDAVHVDDATACAKGSIVAWIDEAHADGAACSDGLNVQVWVVSTWGLRLADVVNPREEDAHASETVAVRAAEIARASLQIAIDDRAAPAATPAPAPPPPPPSIKTLTFGPYEPAEAPQRPKRKAGPPRYAPAFLLGAGASGLFGGTSAPTFGVTAEVGVSRRIAIGARAELPVSTESRLATTGSSARFAPSLLALSLMVPLTKTDSLVIPRVGGGLGVAWLRTEPGAEGFSPSNVSGGSTFITRQRDDIFSAATYMDAAVALRMVGPLHLTLDGIVGTSMQRMVVRVQGEDVTRWGPAFAAVSLRIEAVIR